MNLFVFGLGFTGRRFAEAARGRFDTIRGTVTEDEAARRIAAETGFTMRAFGPKAADPHIAADLADSDALLVSVPPDAEGDPVLPHYAEAIAASRIGWIGYLSTIGVYGDQGGAWIDETTPPAARSGRTRSRLVAEEAWLALGARTGQAVQVFRLSGIYGPGRNPIVKVREGRSQRIVKKGQVFNRIHVDDIAGALRLLAGRSENAIVNVTDDEPAPPQDVVAFAAEIGGFDLPPEVDFESADLTPMARSFYGENKRVRNQRLKSLGYEFFFPTFREGLGALKP